MSEQYDLILRAGTIVSHNGVETTDIGVKSDRIAFIGSLGDEVGDKIINANGLHILPGVIDTQVHFREPGAQHKEDLESGSRGAILGGVTAVFEMPNTRPLTTSKESLLDKLDRAKDRMWCDYAFYVGATANNINDLTALEQLPGCCGVKIFMGSSTGDLLTEDDDTLRNILKSVKRRCAVHAEDEPRLKERYHIAQESSDPATHPIWRDTKTALKATRRLATIARETGARAHVLHITTSEEIQFLASQKDILSVEVTPQHLTLASPSCYNDLGTKAQMNPPIRDLANQDGLWWGITQGVIDVIGSDHAPHTLKEKAQVYPKSPSGMPGVQTLLPIMLNHATSGRLNLLRLIDLTSAGPARLFGIPNKGRIAVGYDADFTLVDLKAKHKILDDDMANKSGWTPFHNWEVTGWPVATIIRGHIVMSEGQLIGKPAGRPIDFT